MPISQIAKKNMACPTSSRDAASCCPRERRKLSHHAFSNIYCFGKCQQGIRTWSSTLLNMQILAHSFHEGRLMDASVLVAIVSPPLFESIQPGRFAFRKVKHVFLPLCAPKTIGTICVDCVDRWRSSWSITKQSKAHMSALKSTLSAPCTQNM